MITKKSILLIDGTYYLYRAYYALPLFTNTLGEPIGAIYGIINMIKKILHDHKPKYMIIIFDSPSKNFRHQLFPEYKKNRKNIPDELKIQINSIYKIIKYLGVSTIIIPNFEADDVIGTLSNYYAQKNNLVLISTNDKDLGQLVSNNIKIINNDNKILGPKEIELKYGVQSQFIPDLLGLMGDTTDNIPGIPGIGKKTAIKLIQNFGSLIFM
jgi:DNA polymerase-1